MKKTVLVVDDDRTLCESLKDYLSGNGLDVLSAHTAEECIDVCSRTRVDVALLDQKLPDGEGHALCPAILERNDQTKIIFSTAYPSFENAVKAIRAGAYDYLSKPFELEELRLAVNRALRTIELERVEQLQRYRSDKEMEESVLIGRSGGFGEVRALIGTASQVDAPVLITGETGSGKNVVAKAIHFGGPLRKAPFVSINCAALPENLIEDELFGHEKGAFTGALTARRGIFEMAEGGTLFLDEIGEMPLHLQSKLLGVLDDKRIRRIGGESARYVNVRIIAATSADLDTAISQKKFREDLYYRLSVVKIHVPPLRERRQDIPELCRYFMGRIVSGRECILPEAEIEKMMDYGWMGNVRELKNVLERAVILRKGPYVAPSELLRSNAGTSSCRPGVSAKAEDVPASLETIEKDHIRATLALLSGNYTRTAKAMGVSLSTLKRKIKKYDIV